MIDLERRYGPFSARVWGLVLNFIANALALYGMAGFLRDGTRLLPMVAGIAATVACILVLAKPSRETP